ncbi:MAG: biopolymer transporter ExbD, partial [Myxococcales bacterium]|nr:biopolymer transporter ExbD [Myxococcales bacterium]
MPKLTPRQRAYIRKRSTIPELDPSEMMGELNIVPFLDIVVNLIMFLLATSEAVLLMAQIEMNSPKIARGRSKSPQEVETPLNLNVTVTDKGVIVSGSGGKLAPGCDKTEAGGGVTVPISKDGYNWSGLTQCAAKVKKQFEDETTVTISADPTIHYEHVVA